MCGQGLESALDQRVLRCPSQYQKIPRPEGLRIFSRRGNGTLSQRSVEGGGGDSAQESPGAPFGLQAPPEAASCVPLEQPERAPAPPETPPQRPHRWACQSPQPASSLPTPTMRRHTSWRTCWSQGAGRAASGEWHQMPSGLCFLCGVAPPH